MGYPSNTLPISDQPQGTPWISFACVMVRRQVIDQIGLLDDGYFMYVEDTDYCRRARAAGWEIWYWPASRVVHLRGGSSPVKSLTAKRGRRPRYYYASRSRYLAKFYGRNWVVGSEPVVDRRAVHFLGKRAATHQTTPHLQDGMARYLDQYSKPLKST